MSVSSSVRAARRQLMASVAPRAFAFVPALVVGVSLAGAVQAGTVNPVQGTTYNLTPANNPITFGTGTNINVPFPSDLPAVYGGSGTQWNVSNYGTITAGGNSGIIFESSSTLTNGASIAGAFDGVSLNSGGTVNNQAGASITGGTRGGLYFGLSGNLTNAGTITGTDGVLLGDGGSVDNQTGGSIVGTQHGVLVNSAAGTVTNDGSIIGGYRVVDLEAGGTVTNNKDASITASGAGGEAIFISNAAGTVTNAGAISATAVNGFGILLNDGGSVTNSAGGTITSNQDGVVIEGASGNIDNAGTITDHNATITGVAAVLLNGGAITNEAGGVLTGNSGVYGKAAFTLTNAGTITGLGDPGVSMFAGGTVDNEAGGTITGANAGVYAKGASADVTNAGSITGGTGQGVVLIAGGSVENQTGGVITGGANGVLILGGADVTNAGTITGTTANGVFLANGGSVANQTGGKISGGNYGVYITGGDASVTNAGSITGVSTGVGLNGTNSSVDNSGSIVSTGKYGFGVNIAAGGGSVTNETGGSISSGRTGVVINGGTGTVTNSGVIQSTYRDGVFLGGGGTVTNNTGGSITGANYGIVSFGDTTITNAGAISATATGNGFGIAVQGAATVNNQAGGAVSGFGGVYAYGGALTLTNAGSITGAGANGVTALSGATVQNAAGGSISGKYVGLYVFGGGAVTNAGTISGGTDSIVFAGAGANTLTLQTGSQLSGEVLGSADAGATNDLILQGAGEADVSFVNFNTLTAQGPGTWVLGGTSTFGTGEVDGGMLVIDGALTAGSTVVNGGNLQVGDAGHAGATLTSPVTVNTGGTLSGHGTVIGDVTNNGTVSPGGSIGTLTINGDYTQSPTGALDIQLTSAGSSRLVVTGTAHLDGALVFTPISGVFRKGQVFDFFDAGAIDGSFATTTFDGPQIFAVSQQGDSFLATVTVGNFAIAGGTLNQRAIVPAFNNVPVGVSDFDPLAGAIIAMAPGAAQNQAVNELGSEISPDLITATRNTVRSQLGGFTEQLAARPANGEGEAGGPFWLQGVGRFGSVSSDGNAHGFDDTTGGIAGGVQHDFGATTFGGAVGYEQTWLTLNGLPQTGNVSTVSAGIYGEQRFGGFFADAGALLGFDHGSEKRLIAAPGVAGRQASGSFDGLSGGAFGLVGDRLAMSGGWTLEPHAGLSWSHVYQDGYTEGGAGGADLMIQSEHQDAVQSLLGARVEKAFGRGFSGEASLDWAHDFNDLTPRAQESFAAVPGTGFTFAGVNPGRDAALVSAGVNYKTARMTFYARYDGSFSNRANDNAITGGLRIAF